MILYFADRLMNIIGTASTSLPKGIVITNDAKTEDVDSGASAFECELSFDNSNRAKVEEITEVGNYLLRSDKGENEFYTIIDCEIDTKQQTVYIYAEDAGLDLLNDIIDPYEANDFYEIGHYVERTASDAGWEIGVNELEGITRKLKFSDEQTGTARLLSIAKEFNDCEISFSFEVKGLQVEKKLINIYEQRGRNTDIQLRLNKQIDSIVTKKTINNLATALKPKGSAPADGENPITLLNHSYDDGDFYVDGDVLKSREALKNWERYLWKGNDDEQTAGHIVKTFTYDTTSQAVLRDKAIEELKKIRDKEVNYEVEITELPESARIGDRVNVIDENGKLYLSTRLLKLVTSAVKQSYKATLGENILKGSGIEEKVIELAQQFSAIAKSRVFYTWIAYADDENGTGITTEPDGKAFIGIAANKTEETVDISDPSVFTWSKIKGEDGKGGEYLYVMYSPYSDGKDMTSEPDENTMYMGTCNSAEETPPEDPSLYTWVQIRGNDGKSVKAVENYYMVTDKNSGVTNTDITQWKLNTIDELTKEKPYLWNFERTIYSDDNYTDSAPALIGNYAKDGDKGVGIKEIQEWYGLSNDESTSPAANAWSQDLPTMTPDMRFLWNYEVIIYTEGAPVSTEPLLIGVYGEKGETGEGVSNVKNYYLATASSSGVTTSTSGWTEAVQATTATKKYLWNYEEIIYTGSKASTKTTPCIIGVFGADGKGISSVTEYYLATSLSSGVTTSTTGWTTTPQTTTTDKKYLWNYEYIVYTNNTTHTTAPVVIGVHGEKGDKGDGIATVKNYYLASSSSSGVTTSTSGWTEAVQTTTASKKYLWNYEEVSFTGSTLQPTKTEPCIIGVYSTDGKGISSVTEYYLATSASSGVTTSTSGWTTTVQTLTATNKYLWNYEVISYTVGNPTTTTPVVIGTYGEKGDAGKSISGVTNYYLASSSSSGVTTSTSGWTEAVQTPTKDKKYLWNYEKVTYSEGSPTYTTPCIIGNFAEEGKEGVSISSVTEYYARSSSSSSAPADSSFGTSVPTLDATYKYLWNYEKIEYTGGKSATYTPKCVIGVFGEDGKPGKGIASTAITYQAHSSGTSTPTGTWSSSIPSVSADSYLWTRTVITYTDNTTSTSYSVAKMGANGSPGKGIKSTSVTYQAHSSGSSTPTGTWSSSIPSLSAGQYLWTRTVITYSDDTTSTSYCVGMKGETGNGIKSTSITYQSHTSGTTAPTGTWSSSIPSVAQGNYLWTKTEITYTDNTTATSYSVSRMGNDGQPGKDGQNLYAESTTAQGTSTKTATLKTGSLTSLTTGVTVTVKFTNANIYSTPNLNVASTGSKQIKWNNVTPTSSNPFYWAAGTVMTFVYDGTYWVVVDVGATKMDLTSDGLVVGNYNSSGNLGNNVLIGASDIKIRGPKNTSTGAIPEYASFGANTIYLGKENSSATINLCSGAAEMTTDDDGLAGSRFLIKSEEEIGLSALNRVGQYAGWDVTGSKRADAWLDVQSRVGDAPEGSITLEASTGTYSGGSISYTKVAKLFLQEGGAKLVCNGRTSSGVETESYIKLNTDSTTIDVSGKISTNTHIQMPYGAYLYGKNSSNSVRALIGYVSDGIQIGDSNNSSSNITFYGKAVFNDAASARTNLKAMGCDRINNTGYYGMLLPDGASGNWIRTTSPGLIPYSQDTTNGKSAIGTSSWPFLEGHFINAEISKFVCKGNTSAMIELLPGSSVNTNIYFRPENTSDYAWYLGSDARRWNTIYSVNVLNTSDKRLKTDITPLSDSSTTYSLRASTDIHSELFDRLKPVQYRFIKGDGRLCYGLVAQDVVESMNELGIDEDELDLVHHYVETDQETGEVTDDTYNMAYNNFIVMLIHEVQKLKTRVNELENPQTEI